MTVRPAGSAWWRRQHARRGRRRARRRGRLLPFPRARRSEAPAPPQMRLLLDPADEG